MVQLKNNGYEDIVIAINPSIPENVKMIQKIKEMVTEASAYMLQATKQRLFIRNVKIVIPKNWSVSSSYTRPKRESYDKADIIIADPTAYGDFPYVLQLGGCGIMGKYIHLTPNFMLNDKMLDVHGPRGRVFVHEWAHLRWGVFDEYNEDKPFYRSKQGNVEATRCPLSIGGLSKIEVCMGVRCQKEDCKIDSDTGLYEEGCEFYPHKDQRIKESIMYNLGLDQVHAFCDESNHNKDAPSEQNRLCNYKSTWEVIRASPDMASTAPLADPNIPLPSFSLLQYKDRVVSLVLDVSGSMNEHGRISRLYQAAEVFIMQIVESGSYVGIVTFSNGATVQTQLVRIHNTIQRDQLKVFLPLSASGGTNICSGVHKGFEINEKIDGSTHGTEIVLLTDGEDNGITSCLNAVKASGAIIHTVALGVNADKGLEQLSTVTGGLNYFVSDYVDANGFIDAFSTITTGSGDDNEKAIQIESSVTTISPFQCLTGHVTIDDTVGNDTFFLVTWTIDVPAIINITDPTGKVYGIEQFVSSAASKSSRLTIPGTAEKGQWEYKICNKEVVDQVLGLTVNSRASDPNVPPIVLETNINTDATTFHVPLILYAIVTQGLTPILGLSVTAIVESQDGKINTLQLLDNGAGSDIVKNDGIYSGYFTQFSSNGRYSLKVRVKRQNQNTELAPPKNRALYQRGFIENGTIISNPPKPQVKMDYLHLGDFTRTASGGSFIVSQVPSGPLPDVFKPSKITDLTAAFQGHQVALSWTATGDDFDKGNASRYDLRMSLSREELLDNFENGTVVDITYVIPQPAGTLEQFYFTPQNITISNGSVLYFAMVAIDKVKQVSEPSNLARASLYIRPPRSSAAHEIPKRWATVLLILLADLTVLFTTNVS
ncbi:calcium-activated chloride channel regulator 1-like [Hyperolius riggenbachi]|uniref:calcium-activated chloride channel regulator 1-like n=1 Tax=Hyperolius riggenbachi TaxID=752182 RepID=UPI0035A2ADCB